MKRVPLVRPAPENVFGLKSASHNGWRRSTEAHQSKNIFWSTVLLVCCIFAPASAYSFEFGLLGGVDSASASISTGPTSGKYSSSLGFGAGAYLDFGSPLGVETGAFYLNRGYAISGFTDLTLPGITSDLSYKIHYLVIPVLAKLSVGSALTLGAGGYFALAMSDLAIHTSFTGHGAGADVNSSATLSSFNLNSTDYGFMANVRLRIPFVTRVGFVIDARYLFGLSNISSATSTSTYLDDLTLMGGIHFSM